MRVNPKVLYFYNKYNTIKHSCLCKKCAEEVLKSNRKGYDYYCPKCKSLLFSDEVNISTVPKTVKDNKTILDNLIKYGVK